MGSVFFRADANRFIGMGHIMRCMSIADAFFSMGYTITFVLADNTVERLINDRGFNSIVIQSRYNDMESEMSFWESHVIRSIDVIIIDSYFVTSRYLQCLKNITGIKGKVVYLDDVAAFPYPVDILVNYNVYGTDIDYESLYINSAMNIPQLICGVTYVPLRSMFCDLPKKTQKEHIENILVSTGGSDELHVAISLIRELLAEKYGQKGKRQYHFLLGAMNCDKDEINLMVSNSEQIIIHEDIDDMKKLISSMDLAVSAAGSTLYEICACGVPLVTYSLADNQILGADAFERMGLAINVGDLRDPKTVNPHEVLSGELRVDAVGKIIESVERLSYEYEKRVYIGKRMQEIVDGLGAGRLANKILSS